MKYKKGDNVIIRADLKIDEAYGNFLFVRIMKKFLGKMVTIQDVKNRYYYIEDSTNVWTDEMISGLNKITNWKEELQNGI